LDLREILGSPQQSGSFFPLRTPHPCLCGHSTTSNPVGKGGQTYLISTPPTACKGPLFQSVHVLGIPTSVRILVSVGQ